ncbi:hypothetical protein GCM10009615_02350 [Corynebacterium durum]
MLGGASRVVVDVVCACATPSGAAKEQAAAVVAVMASRRKAGMRSRYEVREEDTDKRFAIGN